MNGPINSVPEQQRDFSGDNVESNQGEVDIEWGDDNDLDKLASRIQIDPKIHTTNKLAHLITWIFATTLLVVLIGGIWVMLSRSPADAKLIITETWVPFLQGVSNFTSTVFGPLLAFILGFYFGSDKNQGNRSGK